MTARAIPVSASVAASGPPAATNGEIPERVSFAEATRVWAKIGLLGFGGPAGQIALMHRELVEKRKWIDEGRFLHALNYCMLLPGPEAQQLATYVGWLLHRVRGGLVAGTLFVLPGAMVVLALSAIYASLRRVPAVEGLFFGLKAAVLAVVIEALLRIGKRALKSKLMIGFAASGFAALFLFRVPFPFVVLGAAFVGLALGWLRPELVAPPARKTTEGECESVVERMAARGELGHTTPLWRRFAIVVGVLVALWVLPIVALGALFGRESVFVDEGIFFSKAAVVTFGGAYAVLAYVAQQAVEVFGWLEPGEMVDGLGLAETTPGPLILVVQFVGFMGAYRFPGELSPIAAGSLGSAVTVWVTFVPCFLWIFLGAPYVEALRSNRALRAALSAITAAVVGVILNLSVWFGLHVIFTEVEQLDLGVGRILVPGWASVQPVAVLLAVASAVGLLRFKVSLPLVLAASALLGLGWKLAS